MTSLSDAQAWAAALGADPSAEDVQRAHAAAVAHYEVAPLVRTPVGAGATLAAEAPAVGTVATYEVRASTNDASARSAEYETTIYGIAEPESGPAVTIEAPAGRVDCTSTVVVPASSAAAASNYSLAWGREGGGRAHYSRRDAMVRCPAFAYICAAPACHLPIGAMTK